MSDQYRCGTCGFETATLADLACRDWRTCGHFAIAKAAGTLPPTSAVHRYADRIDIKAIKRRLQPAWEWERPQPWGEDAWMIAGNHRGIIVSLDFESEPGVDWVHSSLAYDDQHRMPSYSDLKMLHLAVFGDAWAYQCFAPPAEHINIRGNALHLWGRLDGKPALPDFGRMGTI